MKTKLSTGQNSRSNRKVTLSCQNAVQGKLKIDDKGDGRMGDANHTSAAASTGSLMLSGWSLA